MLKGRRNSNKRDLGKKLSWDEGCIAIMHFHELVPKDSLLLHGVEDERLSICVMEYWVRRR